MYYELSGWNNGKAIYEKYDLPDTEPPIDIQEWGEHIRNILALEDSISSIEAFDSVTKHIKRESYTTIPCVRIRLCQEPPCDPEHIKALVDSLPAMHRTPVANQI